MPFELATVSTNTITISTVQAIDGNLEPNSNNLFANASSLVIGNATHTSVVSAEGVSSPYLSIGNTLDNVTINSTSFQIDSNGANTYIDGFLAQFSGIVSVGNDLELNGGLFTNSSLGNAGDVLHSNGSAVYWGTDDQGVTSVATGNGMTGGTITTTGTVSVLANTGIVANATGVFVNSAYIATISSNSATFLGSSINSGNSSGIYTTGVVTASGIVSGSELTSTLASGDEGGQINLTKPPNGTTNGNIIIDAYQNRLRIYEAGGTNRGAYIDITAASAGVGSNLLAGGSGGFSNGQSISVNNFTLTGSFTANSSTGGSGNFLRSSGTGAYWANVSIMDIYYANNNLAFSATGNSLTTGITTGKSIAIALIFGG